MLSENSFFGKIKDNRVIENFYLVTIYAKFCFSPCYATHQTKKAPYKVLFLFGGGGRT